MSLRLLDAVAGSLAEGAGFAGLYWLLARSPIGRWVRTRRYTVKDFLILGLTFAGLKFVARWFLHLP